MILHIEPKPSATLAAGLTLLHIAAMASAWVSLVNWALALVMTGIVLSEAAALLGARRICAGLVTMEMNERGQVTWVDSSQRRHGPGPVRVGLIAPWLVTFAVERSGGSTQWVVLPPDALAHDQFRRLRVWLRWSSTAASVRATGNNPFSK